LLDLDKLVILSVIQNNDSNLQKGGIAFRATEKYKSHKFDHRVALTVIDALEKETRIFKNSNGTYYLTSWGYQDMLDSVNIFKTIISTL
jgi:hypothetical protein